MKRIFALGLLAMTAPAIADTEVVVSVQNVTNPNGTMVLTVYANKKDWLKRGFLQEKIAVDGQSEIAFTINLPAGDYAFHAYQDLDDNGEMKSNFIGIPKEPTAVSNNAKGRFGPPKFKDAVISVADEPVATAMNLVKID